VSRPAPFRPPTRGAVASLALLTLSGCGLFGGSEPPPQPPGCPPVHALIGADRVSSYRSAEQRVEDLRYFAAINQVRSQCRADGDELEVDIAFEIVAERGPALESGPLELSYFVATLDSAERLVAKQVFPAELTFRANGIAGYRESLTLQLPGVDPRSPPARRLLIGFAFQGAQPPPAPPAQPPAEPPAAP
jgi:hypothetical protein